MNDSPTPTMKPTRFKGQKGKRPPLPEATRAKIGASVKETREFNRRFSSLRREEAQLYFQHWGKGRAAIDAMPDDEFRALCVVLGKLHPSKLSEN